MAVRQPCPGDEQIVVRRNELRSDLFRVLFTELSSYNWDYYQTNFVKRLPQLMLEIAKERVAELRENPHLDEIFAALEDLSTVHSFNPELYPHLASLQHQLPPAICKLHVDALRVHLGIVAPDVSQCVDGDFIRLRHPQLRILGRKGSSLEDLSAGVCRLQTDGAVVYAPQPSLFTDVAAGLYEGRSNSELAIDDLKSLVIAAFDTLEMYNSELTSSIVDTIGTIAFTGDELAIRRSYSFRTVYRGGMFTAICHSTALAENVIHEYYHCSLWTWWLLERPRDLPPDTQLVTSPLTNQARPASVMMHALLIYVSLAAFYRDLAVNSRLRGTVEMNDRMTALEVASEKLVDTLHAELRGCPQSKRFVEHIADLRS